jgi:hypothetical protein
MAFVGASEMSSEEKVLWACVLRRAIFDFVLYKGSGKHKLQWKKAYAFIYGTEQSEGLCFEEICALFGWEPDYLRRLAKSLTREDIKKIYAASVKEDYLELVQTRPQRPLGRTQEAVHLASYSELFHTAVRPRLRLRNKRLESMVR